MIGGLALEYDVTPGEIVGRCLTILPLDNCVLAAVGDRNLKGNIDVTQRNARLSGFGIQQDAQQPDQLQPIDNEHPSI
jgi:hypothetical protein